MTKQAEIDYAVKVDSAHLYSKPYDCPRVLREFATALDILQQHVPGGSILDLGCGPGWTSHFLARAGYDVLGVDISDRMIEIARERGRPENSTAGFMVCDIEALDLERREFDGVLLFDALHHCPKHAQVLQRACAHLRPGGSLLLFEPSWLHLWSPHARAFSRQYGVTELGFTRWGIAGELKRAGFRQVTHYYDSGKAFRGVLGFLSAGFRLACSFLAAYPQTKQIVLARK